jgi:hypothetical protein
MKSYDTLYPAGATGLPHAQQHTGGRLIAEARPHGKTQVATPPRSTSQAERTAMHPDRDDLEWHYCRSGRAG